MRCLLLFLYLLCHGAMAQSPYFNLQFDYNNQWESSGRSVIETDSFFLIPTFSGTPLVDVWDTAFITRINKQNFDLHSEKIGYYEGAKSINLIKASNRYLIQGIHFLGHDYIEDTDFFLCKYDENGVDTSSMHTYGMSGRADYLYRPIQTSDGGIFSSGWSFTPTGIQSIILFKCDSNLNQQFFKLYPSNPTGHHFGGGLVETPDRGVIIAGTRWIGNANANALLFKVDTTGNIKWWKEIPFNGDTTFLTLYDIVPKSDGTYLSVGVRTFNPQVGPSHETFWLVNFDGNGNVLWWKEYDPNFYSGWQTITPSLDGNYYASGVATILDENAPTDAFTQYAVISKLAPNGDLIWHRKYTISPVSKYYDIFFNVLATSDGGILCNGTTYENDNTHQNAWIVKLDSFGCLSAGCQTGTAIQELPVGSNSWVDISPNPTTGMVYINTKAEHQIEALRVFAPNGTLLEEQSGLQTNKLDSSLILNPAGVYIFSVLVDGVWNVRQVVKI